jgi:uncharacterized OB-fold protein
MPTPEEATMPDTRPVTKGLFDEQGLLGGACDGCGRRHFPSAPTCPWCGAGGAQEVRLSTEGRLWSWTAVHTAPPGYEGPVPYGFGVVELPADGLHIVTLLTVSEPDQLQEGDAMRFTTMPVGGGASSWGFAPVTA